MIGCQQWNALFSKDMRARIVLSMIPRGKYLDLLIARRLEDYPVVVLLGPRTVEGQARIELNLNRRAER